MDNVYYLYEVVRRINLMVCRDTKIGEFVTLFYGVLDATTRRFTYCNAGHPAALLLRGGKVTELTSAVNMVLGIGVDEEYQQFFVDLQTGDLLAALHGWCDGCGQFRGRTVWAPSSH